MIMSMGKARKELLRTMEMLLDTQRQTGQQHTTLNEDSIREYICDMDSHTMLAVFLLMERKKGKDSYWKPYIDLLPATYSNMPILFEDAKLTELLEGSYGLEFARKRVAILRRDYDEWMDWCHLHFPLLSFSASLDSDPPDPKRICANELFCTWDDFVWVRVHAHFFFCTTQCYSCFACPFTVTPQARTVVITRIFEISERHDESLDTDEVSDEKQPLKPSRNKPKETQRVSSSGLVPYADMLNHSEEKNTVWTFEPDRCEFIIRAKGCCLFFLFGVNESVFYYCSLCR